MTRSLRSRNGFPDEFVWFANELPDIEETRSVLERYLELGAKGVGEQKFPVACDSQAMQLVYSIARDFDVPVLLHFQHETYNTGIERFHTMLEQFPTVNFIGHAQTWWGNIDADHDQSGHVPQDAGHVGRYHRPTAVGLREHLRRPLGRLWAEFDVA